MAQTFVRPFKIVVLNVLLDHVPNVTLPEEDHAIEALSFGILYPGFSVSICLGRQLHPMRTMRQEYFA